MYYLIILVLLFLAELFYFRIADKCNIIDKPNEPGLHCVVEGSSFILGRWLIFSQTTLNIHGLCWL